MIRPLFPRALALGVAGLVVAAVAMVGAVSLLIGSTTWNHLLLAVFVVVWGLLALMFVVRARPRVMVDGEGVRQVGLGGWHLAWAQIRTVRLTAAELVIEPTTDALQRQSVRSPVQWNRFFAPGRHGPGVVVLPRPRLDAAASRVLRAHGPSPEATRD